MPGWRWAGLQLHPCIHQSSDSLMAGRTLIFQWQTPKMRCIFTSGLIFFISWTVKDVYTQMKPSVNTIFFFLVFNWLKRKCCSTAHKRGSSVGLLGRRSHRDQGITTVQHIWWATWAGWLFANTSTICFQLILINLYILSIISSLYPNIFWVGPGMKSADLKCNKMGFCKSSGAKSC